MSKSLLPTARHTLQAVFGGTFRGSWDNLDRVVRIAAGIATGGARSA